MFRNDELGALARSMERLCSEVCNGGSRTACP